MISEGCKLCRRGAKLVLFITGKCDRSCWYCPLSEERRGKDVIFANEHKIEDPDEAIQIGEKMGALGTGITGGEPFLVPERVREYAERLKNYYGSSHHIHLYTAKAPSDKHLADLSGLVDEIRMHPPSELWPKIAETSYIRSADVGRELGISMGMEIPSLPGIEKIIPALDSLDFLNINELEWGETNAEGMRERGMELSDSLHNAVHGAEGWAESILGHKKVYWCSSSFKDSVQLRERLIRISERTARPFDEITHDGTIVYGLVEVTPDIKEKILTYCHEHLSDDEWEESAEGIQMAWWILEGSEIPGNKYVIERYPDNGLIMEVTPLRSSRDLV